MRSQLTERLGEIDGKNAHVVLLDGKTHSGLVIAADSKQITIRDFNARWTNLRRHTHHLALEDIMEVILDTVTEY
jgi:hypothetical protein